MQTLKTSILLISLIGGCFAQSESLPISPGDQIHIQVFDTPELEQHARVTDKGTLPFLFVGPIPVQGLTPEEAARAIESTLREKSLMQHPQVSVIIEKSALQVSVMGQVNTPGMYDLATPTSIVKVLSLAGGLTDSADRHIAIERHGDKTQRVDYFLSNDSGSALKAAILVQPGDTVLVPKVGTVYVLGDVGRPGGYPMVTNDSTISVLQALALAGAPNHTSILSKARLIRKTPQGPQDVPIDLPRMERGAQKDIAMLPDDVLYLPFSYMKNVALNGTQIAASAASAVIYAGHP